VNIVRVTASSDVLRGLHDIDGLELAGSLTEGDDGLWTTGAYATDEAISELRNRGVRVDVMLDAETRLAQLNRVAAEARGEGNSGAAENET
jgi:hypothetical protein